MVTRKIKTTANRDIRTITSSCLQDARHIGGAAWHSPCINRPYTSSYYDRKTDGSNPFSELVKNSTPKEHCVPFYIFVFCCQILFPHICHYEDYI